MVPLLKTTGHTVETAVVAGWWLSHLSVVAGPFWGSGEGTQMGECVPGQSLAYS